MGYVLDKLKGSNLAGVDLTTIGNKACGRKKKEPTAALIFSSR